MTALPTVASARFDRAYPHTLRVVVVPERPVAVVRQGADSLSPRRERQGDRRTSNGETGRRWLGSGSSGGRAAPGAAAEGDLRTAVTAVAPLAGSRFPGRVSSVTTTPDALTLRLRSGLEIRLGDPLDVPLKLAVAGRGDPAARRPRRTYLDVSVPERPVAGTLDSQVEVEGSPSTQP